MNLDTQEDKNTYTSKNALYMSSEDYAIYHKWMSKFPKDRRSTIANRLLKGIRHECVQGKYWFDSKRKPLEIVLDAVMPYYHRDDFYAECIIDAFNDEPLEAKQITDIVYNRERNVTLDIVVNKPIDSSVRPPTDKQLRFLKQLGYIGEVKSVKHAQELIGERVNGRKAS